MIDPNGKVLRILSEEEGVLEYELTDNVGTFRKSFGVKYDRNEQLYCELMHTI